MMSALISSMASWAIHLISALGYGGIFLTQLLESALIPIPSEIVLPFSGFLASTGQFNFWLVLVFAYVGNLIGSSLIFFIGWYGGRPLIEKYGKYVLIHQ